MKAGLEPAYSELWNPAMSPDGADLSTSSHGATLYPGACACSLHLTLASCSLT